MRARTQYAKSGDVHIAYQVVGEGPLDLILVHGWVSHLEHQWDDPSLVRVLERLAAFSRLIMFDKRGTGLSDRVSDSALPTLEQRMDDVRAVMDAVGSTRAADRDPDSAIRVIAQTVMDTGQPHVRRRKKALRDVRRASRRAALAARSSG